MMFKRQIWKFLMSLFKVLNVKKLWTLPSWNISKSFTFLEKILKKAVDAWYGCVSWQNNSFWHFTKQLFLILYSLNHRNSTLRVNTLNVENSVSNYFLRKTFHINKGKTLDSIAKVDLFGLSFPQSISWQPYI